MRVLTLLVQATIESCELEFREAVLGCRDRRLGVTDPEHISNELLKDQRPVVQHTEVKRGVHDLAASAVLLSHLEEVWVLELIEQRRTTVAQVRIGPIGNSELQLAVDES